MAQIGSTLLREIPEEMNAVRYPNNGEFIGSEWKSARAVQQQFEKELLGAGWYMRGLAEVLSQQSGGWMQITLLKRGSSHFLSSLLWNSQGLEDVRVGCLLFLPKIKQSSLVDHIKIE